MSDNLAVDRARERSLAAQDMRRRSVVARHLANAGWRAWNLFRPPVDQPVQLVVLGEVAAGRYSVSPPLRLDQSLTSWPTDDLWWRADQA